MLSAAPVGSRYRGWALFIRKSSPELLAALRNLREVRSGRPLDECNAEAFAAWRERIADALDSLAVVLIYSEDRQRAVEESEAARAEAARIRSRLNDSC